MTNKTYRVTAHEIHAFIQRIELTEAEKVDAAAAQKAVYEEAKSSGYDTKVLRKLVALRKP